MINSELKEKYQDWAKKVNKKINTNKEKWVEQYSTYAKNMLKNKEEFIRIRRKFNQCPSLRLYLTIGNVKDGTKIFDLRYLGQSTGTIHVNGDNVLLSVSETQFKNNKKWFGDDYEKIGRINNADWKNSKEAKMFRKFFKNCKGLPRQKEHMVENALFSEFEKKQSYNKTLCHITPVSFAGTRIHMKTALKASYAKKDLIEVSTTGGEIDLFCRRTIGFGKSRLVVIEIKDDNIKEESFDITMKQAISYALFVRALIHSEETAQYWMEIWGMSNQRRVAEQKKTGYTIDCVVAMPEGETKPSYCGDILDFDNSDGTIDHLALHYIELPPEIHKLPIKNVKFNTSLKHN